MSKQKILEFESVKPQIIQALKEPNRKITITEPVSLVDGFVSQFYSMEMTDSIVLGGPTIPIIMLLGESGQIYFFALKALIENFGENE